MLTMLNRHLLGKSLNKIQLNNSRLLITAHTQSTFTNNQVELGEDNVLKENPYYEIYKEKLHRLKQENLTAYKEKVDKLKAMKKPSVKVTNEEIGIKSQDSKTDSFKSIFKAKPARIVSQTNLVKQKMLIDVMNIELLQQKSITQISEIWIQYHKEKKDTPVLSAVIPYKNYKAFYVKSLEYPMFVLPLPRTNQGYEFMLVQFQHYDSEVKNCTAHLTPLIAYQKYNENAPECMSIEYFSDLVNENNIDNSIVLMRSFYDDKLLSSMEATCLVNQLRIFYEENNFKHETLLKLFNKGHSEFHYSDVIACVETLSI
ncbi:ATP synthase mitochondrial F1 complex assembly factor 1 [Daktulosphaira vitifoliae]|uniref:ATP synthase mitochondrial F1 complex assembly factor 1 n=1 Tax=Daktulosphaira vitifoliae TaxID=58002 RepID=UPI0021AAC63E|nr:ATP synthase mitochondrial F1 complex assembly factor 1 [Daktulosphaira vitifoliae]